MARSIDDSLNLLDSSLKNIGTSLTAKGQASSGLKLNQVADKIRQVELKPKYGKIQMTVKFSGVADFWNGTAGSLTFPYTLTGGKNNINGNFTINKSSSSATAIINDVPTTVNRIEIKDISSISSSTSQFANKNYQDITITENGTTEVVLEVNYPNRVILQPKFTISGMGSTAALKADIQIITNIGSWFMTEYGQLTKTMVSNNTLNNVTSVYAPLNPKANHYTSFVVVPRNFTPSTPITEQSVYYNADQTYTFSMSITVKTIASSAISDFSDNPILIQFPVGENETGIKTLSLQNKKLIPSRTAILDKDMYQRFLDGENLSIEEMIIEGTEYEVTDSEVENA